MSIDGFRTIIQVDMKDTTHVTASTYNMYRTHVCLYILHVYMYTYMYMCTCLHVCIPVHLHVYMYTCIYTYTYTCTLCTRTHVYMCALVHYVNVH